MMHRRSGIAFAVAAGLALTLAACTSSGGGAKGSSAASGSQTHTAGGTLTVAEPQDWGSLDPDKANSATVREPLNAVYDRLFTTSATGAIEPDLATSYTVNAGGTVYTLTLRSGVAFQDGTPFDAAAVKVNLDRVRAANSGCSCATAFQYVTSVAAQNASTVVVTLSAPDAAFPRSGLAGLGALMISPTALQKYGADIGLHPVGTGPFEFVSAVSGYSLTLKKNPHYWKPGLPYLDGVVFKVVSDPQTEYSSVQSGAVQIADGITATQAVQGKSDSRVVTQQAFGLSNYMVFFNTTTAPFNDIRARQAVTAATDRTAINQVLNQGLSSTDVDSPFSPSNPYYPGKTVPNAVGYDLAKAKALVAQLGGLTVTLTTIPSLETVAEALQSMWGQAGIKTVIKSMDEAAFGAAVFGHQYQAAPFYLTPPSEDPADTVYFVQSTSPANALGLKDSGVDALIRAGLSARSDSQRHEIYDQLSAKLAALTPIDYLAAVVQFRMTSKDVHGVPMTGDRWLDLSAASLS